MLSSWIEIEEAFSQIHYTQSAKTKVMLADILASGYVLDAQRASNMWQSAIDRAISINPKNERWFVVSVFRDMLEILPVEHVVRLLLMEEIRLRSFVLTSPERFLYPNGIYYILGYMIKHKIYDGAVHLVDYLLYRAQVEQESEIDV